MTHIDDFTTPSYIDFGTPNPAVMATSPDDIVYLPIQSENKFWGQSIQGVRFGTEMNDQTEYKLEDDLIFDTGASCIIGPDAQISSIRQKVHSLLKTRLYQLAEFSVWDGLFACSEKSNLPEIEFLIGGYWFTVQTEDYVHSLTHDDCSLCL